MVVAGDTTVDLGQGLATLAGPGARLVLCEDGPTLNGELASAGLIDELCLTVAPSVVGGAGARIFGLRQLDQVVGASLLHVLEEEGFLFLRYRVEAVGE